MRLWGVWLKTRWWAEATGHQVGRGTTSKCQWIARAWRALPDPLYIELASGVTATTWGGWVFCYPKALYTQQLYAVLRDMFPTPVMPIVFSGFFGVMQLVCVAFRWRLARLIACAGTGTFWFLLALSFHVADGEVPGFITHAGFGTMNLWAMTLLVRERRL